MADADARDFTGNRLLDGLPAHDYRLISEYLSGISYKRGSSLYESGDDVSQVFFPTEGVVSILTVMSGGATVETAAIGREGLVGVTCGPMNGRAVSRAVAQTDGTAACLDIARFHAALAESAEIRRALSYYTESLFVQVQQTAACNALHNLEARLARWLLTFADRGGGGRLNMTQEDLAEILGVRRATISEVSAGLEKPGLIRRGRGSIEIVDRRRLEVKACECYRTLRAIAGKLEAAVHGHED